MIKQLALLSLTAIGALSLGGPALAAGNGVDVHDNVFEAWTLRCETRQEPAPAEKRCGLMSVVRAQDETGRSTTLTSIMLRPASTGAGYQLSFNLPLSVLLPGGARIADANGQEIVRLPFIACRSQGCEAGAVLTDAQFLALQSGGAHASVSFDLQSAKTAKIDFSMNGFLDAYRELSGVLPAPARAAGER